MSQDDSMNEGLQAFAEESKELIELSESTLLKLEEEPDNHDLIGELFRSIHTIKGASGIFGFNDVVDFTHVAESVMGRIRDKELGLNETLTSIFLESVDHISLLITHALSDKELSEDVRKKNELLLAQLNKYLDPSSTEAKVEEVSATTDSEDASGPPVANDYWHISIRFDQSVLQNGMDPLSFFRYLNMIGDIVTMTTLTDGLPELETMNPENCYLGYEIDLKSAASKQEIAKVFEFVEEDCSLHILPPRSSISEYMALIDELPEDNYRIGEILLKAGAITQQELSEILCEQDELRQDSNEHDDNTNSALGKLAIEKGMVNTPVIDSAVEKQKKIQSEKAQQQQTLRIDAGKLSHLINLVGELVIASADINSQANVIQNSKLSESTENFTRLVDEIRGASLGLRMVQIGDTFSRYKRVVRDLCKEFDKKIELVIEGGETELDKTVIEKISDPLLHMVRNAIDHGIELPEDRLKLGKQETATLRLKAYHESGSIAIEISDDGRGLNKQKILAKAEQQGLLKLNQPLSEQEIYRLIFEPGFSTAEKVSAVSGRGVGMDVVRRNIEDLRGQINVESLAGKGSKFTIRLPLTLAIIDGFHVNVSGNSYIIPLGVVDECIELSTQLYDAANGSNYINLRGEVLPYVRMSKVFSEADGSKDHFRQNSHRENIVVVNSAGQKAGLVVDELLGEQQAVIKPLGKIFEHLTCISGATILGGGDIAMILDVPQLLNLS